MVGHLAVPGRWRPPTPCGGHRDRDRLHGERRQRPGTAELTDQQGEGLVIGATRGSGQARLGETRRGGVAEGLLGGCQGDNPPDHRSWPPRLKRQPSPLGCGMVSFIPGCYGQLGSVFLAGVGVNALGLGPC